MFGRKGQDDDPGTTLARCIVLLDDIRAYRRKDVEQIEEQFAALKKTRFKEHYDMWVKARPSVESIVDMPAKAPGVKNLIRTISWMKVVNKVLLTVVVLFVAFQIVPLWRSMLGYDFLSGTGLIILIAVILVAVASLNVVTFLDYRIRKRIIAYEDSTTDQYAPAREKMKECVNKMMKSLAREAVRNGKDRDYYGLVLYFDDYSNIEVVSHWRPRSMGVFKKSYNHYQVVPKA